MSPIDPRVLQAFSEALTKEGSAGGYMSRLGQHLKASPRMGRVATHLADHGHVYDLAGLGGMMGLEAAHAAHSLKKDPMTGKRDWRGALESGAEGAFLGTLAAPVAANLLLKRPGGAH